MDFVNPILYIPCRFHHTCTRTATYIAERLCYHCCDKCSLKRQRENSHAKDSNDNYFVVPPHLDARSFTVGPNWNQFVENSMKEEFVVRLLLFLLFSNFKK